MFTGKTGYKIPWYYLLVLFCVEAISTHQGSVVQRTLQLHQEKMMSSCIDFSQITSLHKITPLNYFPMSQTLFITLKLDL